MSKFLHQGDVIRIEKGMKVYAKIPAKFVYYNGGMSNELTNTEVVIGQIRTNSIDAVSVKKNLVKDIQQEFQIHLGITVNRDIIKDFVSPIISQYKQETFDTSILEGDYVVVKTEHTGGGTGHGMYDVYPDGHKVTCKQLNMNEYDKNGVEISFYQSGSFTAMIMPEQIQPIRKMEMNFV